MTKVLTRCAVMLCAIFVTGCAEQSAHTASTASTQSAAPPASSSVMSAAPPVVIHDADLCTVVGAGLVEDVFREAYGKTQSTCTAGLPELRGDSLAYYEWSLSPQGGIDIRVAHRYDAAGADVLAAQDKQDIPLTFGELPALWSPYSCYVVGVDAVAVNYCVTPISYPPTPEVSAFIEATAKKIAAATTR